MSNFFADNAASIGRTPLVRLNRLAAGSSRPRYWPRLKAAARPTP